MPIDLYDVAFKVNGIPLPVREYRFCPDRKWRIDFAWPDVKFAVEMEGGVYMRSGGCHQRPIRFIGDLEKYNMLTELGWCLLRYPTGKIDYSQIGRVINNLKNRCRNN